jgi:cytochrome c
LEKNASTTREIILTVQKEFPKRFIKFNLMVLTNRKPNIGFAHSAHSSEFIRERAPRKQPRWHCRPPHRTYEERIMKKLNLRILVVIAFSTTATAALAQDVAAGKTSFNKCMACHSIGEGAKNKVGPELNGLDGRKSGTAPDYSYSDANKNSGITWNEAQFKEYIKDPKAKVPGTKMAFAGIKNDKEVNDLWAFISQYDKDGKTK